MISFPQATDVLTPVTNGSRAICPGGIPPPVEGRHWSNMDLNGEQLARRVSVSVTSAFVENCLDYNITEPLEDPLCTQM